MYFIRAPAQPSSTLCPAIVICISFYECTLTRHQLDKYSHKYYSFMFHRTLYDKQSTFALDYNLYDVLLWLMCSMQIRPGRFKEWT